MSYPSARPSSKPLSLSAAASACICLVMFRLANSVCIPGWLLHQGDMSLVRQADDLLECLRGAGGGGREKEDVGQTGG